MYCEEESDNPEHKIFVCEKWHKLRARVKKLVGKEVTSENIIELMVEAWEKYEAIEGMLMGIMRTKKEEREKTKIKAARRETVDSNTL